MWRARRCSNPSTRSQSLTITAVRADYIENAVVSLHEPYASSASELVSELLQYLVPTSGILTCEAEAMLAGIYLDTKGLFNAHRRPHI